MKLDLKKSDIKIKPCWRLFYLWNTGLIMRFSNLLIRFCAPPPPIKLSPKTQKNERVGNFHFKTFRGLSFSFKSTQFSTFYIFFSKTFAIAVRGVQLLIKKFSKTFRNVRRFFFFFFFPLNFLQFFSMLIFLLF